MKHSLRSGLVVLAALLLVRNANTQPLTDSEGDVGIGTLSPDPSAILDINSTQKGLLLPRLTQSQRDAIPSPATGLTIFESGSATIQYNYGTPSDPAWVRVLTDSTIRDVLVQNAWLRSGNAGTTPWDGTGGDFVGSTDDVDVVLATNGQEQARLYAPANGGGFGISGAFRLNGDPGDAGEVLTSQGAGLPPVWSDDLAVDMLTVNGGADFNGSVTFSTLPTLPLPQGNLLVGDAAGEAASFPPGTSGQVLQVDGGGLPAWQSVNLLPTGTTVNSTLVWDGSMWVENTAVTIDPATGDVVVGGDLTVNGTTVTLPAGSVDNSELANSSINLAYGTGLSGDASVSLGGTLNLQNTGVTSVAGTPNQVNVSGATGAVTLSLPQDIHTDATPTFDGVVLDNLPTGSAATEVVTSNGGTLETRTINSLIGAATLTEGSLWVGDAGNNPTELPVGTPGQVLQIDGGGAPSWQMVNVLPSGTTPNTTLVWNGTMWVENTGVTMDPTTGDVVVGGDLTVNGATVTLPAGSVDNGELANSSINLAYGTGLSGDASVSLGGTLNLQNTGVTSVAGTPNQVNVSGATGAVTLSLPQDIHTDATPTFDGVVLDNLPTGSAATEVVTSNGGTLETRTINSLIGAATLTEGSLWVGDAGNNPAELPVGANGEVLTIVGGVPAWTVPGGAPSMDITTASTTDEDFAIRGTASGATTDQVIGIWGRATDGSATNTGTIGILATGNGNTTAGETNVALQLNDGEFTMGRTTETGTGYTVVEGGAAGTAYSAEGPSGVIEFNLSLANSSPLAGALVGVLNTLGTPLGAPTLGTSVNSLLGASVFNTTLTVNNRYVTPESIVLTQVLSIADTDVLEDLLTLFQNGTLTSTTVVTNRQDGSFDLTIDLRALGPVPAVNNGEIRVGYVVVNPSR